MKFFYTCLVLCLSTTLPLFSQTIVHWPLTPGQLGTANTDIDEAMGLPFERGNGLSVLNFSGSGVSAQNWSTNTNEEAQVDYYEFGVKASSGSTLELSELSFSERRSSTGPLTFRITYSRDGFATQTELAQVNLPDNIDSRSHTFSFLEKLKDGEELRFRFYAFGAESNSGSWTIRSNSLRLAGAAMETCSPPSSTANLYLISTNEETATVSLTAGNGQARMLVITTANQPLSTPYQGDAYSGSLVFGEGQLLGNNTYVLAVITANTANLTIQGLTPGTAYELAIFEYNTGQMCYAPNSVALPFSTQCTSEPSPVEEVRFTSLDGSVALRWAATNCADKYLVVAADQAITGAPQGEVFTADETFGNGQAAAGFPLPTYPVYYGNEADPIVVTGLDNGTAYYFAVYVLQNGQWSTAYHFTVTPEESCPRLYPERIFINEIHYLNGPVSQDQGVEIAGPAGVDLANYELVIYQRVGNLNVLLFEVHRCQLTGLIDDEGAGFGAIWFPLSSMPRHRGAVQLVNSITNEVVDLVGYDPAFGIRDLITIPGVELVGPPPQGLVESSNDPAGYSIQRIGEGNCPSDYIWARLPHSRGILNPGQAILPVALNFLAAEAREKTARIYWQTSAESGSDYFVVEHSADGRQFTKLGELPAAGFSQEIRNYELFDLSPTPGLNYYRLLQVDYDGTVHQEGIVTVQFDNLTPGPLTVFPNPVADFTTVSWSQSANRLQLTNAQGQLLRSIPLDAAGDGGTRLLDMSTYPAGFYLVRLVSEHRNETRQIIKH